MTSYIRANDHGSSETQRELLHLAMAMTWFPLGAWFAVKILIDEIPRLPHTVSEILKSPRGGYPYLFTPVLGYFALLWIPWHLNHAIIDYFAETNAFGGGLGEMIESVSQIPGAKEIYGLINMFL